jgi:N6-adenosine-specific RNA methylase IME4
VPPWGRASADPCVDGSHATRDLAPAETYRIVHDLSVLIDRGDVFRCIYADPPWAYENRASRGAAENHYPTMSVQQLCQLPIWQLADTSAHLHLWTTTSFLYEAKQVIDAWGFRYKLCFVWVKPQLGMGNYWRVSHEYLLLGVRGRLRFSDNSLRSWLHAKRTSHSTKPDKIRKLVEQASPAPRLELFGRRTCPGWTVYGNYIQRRLF